MISKEEAIKLFKEQVPETKIERIAKYKNGYAAICIGKDYTIFNDISNPYFYVDNSKKVSRIDTISNLDVFDAFSKED